MRISGCFLIFQAIAVFSSHLSEGIKIPRSLRKERKPQKSSLISKEKVNKVGPSGSFWQATKATKARFTVRPNGITDTEKLFSNYLVNLFLTNLVRISGFSSLFPAIAVLSAHFPREY